MKTLPCGHVADAGDVEMCEHLVAEQPPFSYRCFTGQGVEYTRLCESCVDGGLSATITVCVGCVARASTVYYSRGSRGRPGFVRRDAVLAEPTSVACQVVPRNEYCLTPMPEGWLALTDDGLVRVADDGSSVLVC